MAARGTSPRPDTNAPTDPGGTLLNYRQVVSTSFTRQDLRFTPCTAKPLQLLSFSFWYGYCFDYVEFRIQVT